ncbi:MAG: hypothetical protein EOO15_07155 [Chitinophagaceae bacterium]|nr:MAG: hypothetical protein EOO15_07155 [Chitinophagaceae bacterium]
MSFDALNERLNEASLRRDQLARARARFDGLEADLAAAKERLASLESILSKEQKDYERLEGRSLQALFYSVLGNKEQQLEKERQEYLAALLKRDEALSRIRQLEQEREAHLAEARQWAGAEEQYRALLVEKEQQLIALGDDTARRIQSCNDRLRGLAGELREIEEAERAGLPALQALREVERCLNGASNWGTWDMLGGGGLATWAKHDRIDDPRAALHRAQQALQHFANELTDLGHSVQWQLDLGGLTTFADYFFDNLITDWIVQQGIHRSLEATRDLGRRVEQLVMELRARKERLADDARTAAAEKAALLAH